MVPLATDGVALVVACAVVFCVAGALVVWPVAAVLPDVLDILLGWFLLPRSDQQLI